jgi:YggT family protein
VLPLMLLDIIGYLIWIIQCLVIVLFVMSLLISFNVVNTHNEFVASIWKAVNVLLDPLLNPIRRIMPNTGAIDFSPMVLVIILEIVGKIIIPRLAMAVM